jgi:hypothetical protein
MVGPKDVRPTAPEWLHRSGHTDLLDGFTDREVGLIVLADIDYEAQLSAVHALLHRQDTANQSLKDEIVKIEAFAKKSSGLLNQRAADEWVEHLHASVYQDAAHSMAAVGMLAPLFESILCQSFNGIRRILETEAIPLSSHARWQRSSKEQWDCHFVFTPEGRAKNLVAGVSQLAEAVGLTAHLPKELTPTLGALFAYRNKMFHFGFEWPIVERERFQKQTSDWPSDWFSATSDHKPWIFYLTDTFISHCLATIDGVLSGVGAFARHGRRKGHRDHRLPVA